MIHSISNEIFFRFRKSLPRLRRRAYSEKVKESSIVQDFFSKNLAESLEEKSLRQALFYAWILEDIPFGEPQKKGRVLDLGSKDFVYAPALAGVLSKYFSDLELTGLELDPYQIYYNFYRREDVARYYVELTNKEFFGRVKVNYQQGDWLSWQQPPQIQYDCITSFFPFLYPDLHSRFGLPLQSFSPTLYYAKAFRLAKRVLFFHQGKEELQKSLSLIQALRLGDVVFQKTYFENPWIARKFPVKVILWESKSGHEAHNRVF